MARQEKSEKKNKPEKPKKKGFVNEFKEFAFKGNAIELAVGIVIGAAFNAIVNSFVENIIMPVVGFLTAGKNFHELDLKIGEADFKYGIFIQSLVDFLIIAFTLFLVIKVVNKIRDNPQENEPAAPTEAELLVEIRDLLAETSEGKK